MVEMVHRKTEHAIVFPPELLTSIYHVSQNDVEEKLDVKYRDWINKQEFRTKPCDGDQDEESHYKEKIAAIFEKLVEFAEPVILDEHGELPVFLHLSWALF